MNTRTCRISGAQFWISDSEFALYKSLDVTPPTLSPDERARTRLAWRNERTLHRRKCDATGQPIVSIFDERIPFPVFSQSYWWSDSWDALSHGVEFDFAQPFFPQFAKLFRTVPQCALRCPQSENCEYTNQCEKNKDCYMVFCSNGSRECLHGMWFQQCIDSLDCTYLEQSELCYEILNGKNCYGCTNCDNVQNCSDCHFSRDLIGCNSCIGCVNLRNKRYCIFNEQLSKAEFESQKQNLKLGSRAQRQRFSRSFEIFAASFPRKFYSGKNNENSTGDYLENNKNVSVGFNCRNSENLFHTRDAWSGRNSIDLTETLDQDYCIELEGCCANVNSGFSAKISETHDTWYCSHCFNSHDLFGCVGLKQKQYCIFNKQHSKEDYSALRSRIIAHMRETGEFGEYFPLEYSPFPYNESVAQEYFPLEKTEALSYGLLWREPEPVAPLDSIRRIADEIKEVTDDISETVLFCEESLRGYKIQKPELRLYRKLNIPLPSLHPDLRHTKRMARRNQRVLQEGQCAECEKAIVTTFPIQSKAKILCEECYERAVE